MQLLTCYVLITLCVAKVQLLSVVDLLPNYQGPNRDCNSGQRLADLLDWSDLVEGEYLKPKI